MKLLVTGREGQLALNLIERAAAWPDLELVRVGRPQVDLETPGSLAAAIRDIAPDVVVNAAAYTAVDQAEDESERAFRINADAAGEAAAAAQDVGASIIQISTDYVFDGRSELPYREDAATAPLGVYGVSKLAGEEQVRANNSRHAILRTAWVYSHHGRNFVKTMLRVAEERSEVSVVADQRGSPTSGLDLADAVLTVADAWRTGAVVTEGNTFHVAGDGSCTWAEFASELFRWSNEYGGHSATVRPISTADFPTRAVRPANSMLDCTRFEQRFSVPMRFWKESVGEVVGRIVAPGGHL